MATAAQTESAQNSSTTHDIGMAKEDTKGDISRANLQLHRIYIRSDDYQIPENSTQPSPIALSDHIDAIREGLLEMRNIIPHG
jgi:hypothetical protein